MEKSIYKLIFIIIAGLLGSATASGVPASGRPVKMLAPDGREVWVTAVGDENSRHYVYTENGKLVEWLPVVNQNIGAKALSLKLLKTANRFQVDDFRGVTRVATSARSDNGEGEESDNGEGEESHNGRFLVILVDFPDRPFKTAEPHEAFEAVMNGEEMPVKGSYASAKKYFEDNSCGQFVPQFDVVGPVTTNKPASYYASVGIDDSPTGKLVKEVCLNLNSQIDFSEYDHDGDGVCDNIYLFFAGKGQADGGGSTTIWPHAARLDIDWNITVDVDGVRISNYACSAELNGSGQFSGIGTFCHEFCHVLGLPDLYYSGVPHPQYFSLMASGNYNNNGFTPPALSSYERYALGWLEPTQITHTEWITLGPLTESGEVKIVKTDNENEYFLLENRQKRQWDQYLPGHGMLVWHIDYDQSAWDNNIPNADRNHQRVYLIRANNNTTGYPGEGAPFPGTMDVDAFDATTTPAFVAWDGTAPDCALSTISETPAGNITFQAEVQNSGIGDITAEIPVADEEVIGVYTIDGRRVNSDVSALPAGIYIRVTAAGASKFVK